MEITTKQYIKKPLYVDAVQVTEGNFRDVARWCEGHIRSEPGSSGPESRNVRYIKVDAHNAISTRQTKAYVGDWILKTERGYKVYNAKAFAESFDEVIELEHMPEKTYPHIDGGFVIIGPECFAAHDGTVLNWKGTNYVPQNVDRSVEAQVQTEMEKA